jgi:sugar phosphate isomerase/epimerase
VINQIGTVPDEAAGPAWEMLSESLSELGRYGQRAGAMLTAETGTESGETLLKLIEALPAGTLPVAFNPGNLLVQGFSPQEALALLAPHVRYVCARDATRDLARGRGIEVPLGRGSVDFVQLLATLDEQQYRGFITIDREGLSGPAAEVADGVQYLHEVMGG